MTVYLEKDHYESKKTVSAFNKNYIQYKRKTDKDKTLFIDDYSVEIIPYLSDITNDYKTQVEWKINLTIAVNLILLKILMKL